MPIISLLKHFVTAAACTPLAYKLGPRFTLWGRKPAELGRMISLYSLMLHCHLIKGEGGGGRHSEQWCGKHWAFSTEFIVVAAQTCSSAAEAVCLKPRLVQPHSATLAVSSVTDCVRRDGGRGRQWFGKGRTSQTDTQILNSVLPLCVTPLLCRVENIFNFFC